jgi:hypothetical protein
MQEVYMTNIINTIFPRQYDNSFKGNKIALYVFYLLTLVTMWRSQHHLFAADGGAQSIATIPLDQLTTMGATAVVSTFSLWGLSQLLIGIIYFISAVRYKSLIPLLYVLMLFEYVIRLFYIGNFKPMPTLGTAPGAIGNYIFIGISILMIILSIPKSKKN